ncbi:TPA: hypothetical protein ACGO4F_002426, partial [Streptococcus suis]
KTGAVTIPADKVQDGSTVSAVSKDDAGNTSSPSTDTAKKDPTTADKTEPNKPAVTEVKDPANLTEDEKAKVKEEVEKANPDLPTGTTVEVGNDGTVTVKYPDGSTDTIPGSDTVAAKDTDKDGFSDKEEEVAGTDPQDSAKTPEGETSAERLTPNLPPVTEVTDPANLTDAEKDKVKEEVEKANPDFPAGTEVEVGNDGTVTVKYPDGSTDTIPGSGTVVAKDTDKDGFSDKEEEVAGTDPQDPAKTPEGETSAERLTPNLPPVTEVKDPANLTDAEKDKVKEEVEKANPDFPAG